MKLSKNQNILMNCFIDANVQALTLESLTRLGGLKRAQDKNSNKWLTRCTAQGLERKGLVSLSTTTWGVELVDLTPAGLAYCDAARTERTKAAEPTERERRFAAVQAAARRVWGDRAAKLAKVIAMADPKRNPEAAEADTALAMAEKLAARWAA